MRPINRIMPRVGPNAYQTFDLTAPRDQMVKAACSQVGCEAWLKGWDTTIDERTDLGRTQAAYIRQGSGRTFKELKTADGLTVFRFESRQRCFREHHTRPEIYRVFRGDLFRANLGLIRAHTRPDDWVEDFAGHQQSIADAIEKG